MKSEELCNTCVKPDLKIFIFFLFSVGLDQLKTSEVSSLSPLRALMVKKMSENYLKLN